MKTFKRVGLDVKVVSRTILGSCLMATNAHMTRSETYPEASGPKNRAKFVSINQYEV